MDFGPVKIIGRIQIPADDTYKKVYNLISVYREKTLNKTK